MKDYIFFDLDGTLTDSKEGLFNGLRKALLAFNIEKSDEELMPFLGPSLWDSLPEYAGLNGEECRKAVEIYREYYFSKGIFENKLYPGIENLLEKLKKSGRHMSVATGKPQEQAEIVTDYFKITGYFDGVFGTSYDQTLSKKEQVIRLAMENLSLNEKDCSRIIMVGDRKNDIIGAHKNNIEVCTVLYGYGNIKEFEENKADYICDSVLDLQELLLHPAL